METTWEKIRTNVISTYQSLSKKTVEMTKIGRLKLEIVAIKRDIEKAFIELGGRVFQAFEKKDTDKILSDENVHQLVEQIRKKQSSMKDLKDKIERIRNQEYSTDES